MVAPEDKGIHFEQRLDEFRQEVLDNSEGGLHVLGTAAVTLVARPDGSYDLHSVVFGLTTAKVYGLAHLLGKVLQEWDKDVSSAARDEVVNILQAVQDMSNERLTNQLRGGVEI